MAKKENQVRRAKNTRAGFTKDASEPSSRARNPREGKERKKRGGKPKEKKGQKRGQSLQEIERRCVKTQFVISQKKTGILVKI